MAVSLTGQDAVTAPSVLQDFFGMNEMLCPLMQIRRSALVPRIAGEIDDFGRFAVIVAERDRVRLPAPEQLEKLMDCIADHQPHRVTGLSGGCGDKPRPSGSRQINLR